MQRVFGGLFGLMLTLAIGLAAVPAQAVTIGVLPVGGSYSDTISSGGPTFSRDYNFSLAGGANNVSILATAFGQSSSDFGVDLLKIALGAQTIGEEGEVDALVAAAARDIFDRSELIDERGLRVEQQAPDQCGLAVVDGAGGREAQEVAVVVEAGGDERFVESNCSRHQK